MWQVYQNDDVLVFGLHQGEDAAALQAFQQQTGVTFPILHAQSTLNKFSFPQGVGYPYPRDVVIGKDGIVRAIRNSFNPGELSALVGQLLAEP